MNALSYECRNAIEVLYRVAKDDYHSARLVQATVKDPELFWSMVMQCGSYLLRTLDVMSQDPNITTPDGMHLAGMDEIVAEMRAQLSGQNGLAVPQANRPPNEWHSR
jgi:hypothetical protein